MTFRLKVIQGFLEQLEQQAFWDLMAFQGQKESRGIPYLDLRELQEEMGFEELMALVDRWEKKVTKVQKDSREKEEMS